MALTPGTRFGPYEIDEKIGAGGMGEVFRATDTRLKRHVAMKVLPESFASNADRLARFQREAEVLASLNHPNIAQIHGLEEAEGTTALVLELVEGPTLADRIAEGPLPADEALHIAMQIADALEAAHERQIVHRDLKPANIKLRPDGTVKVLDFGIAKALESPTGAGGEPAAELTTPAMTQAGVLLGTAAYMSPEQARGKPVDRRSDIWAFGCVLYEMLTGQPAFGGEDVPLTLARVLSHGTDMKSLPAAISPAVRHTIALCLTKDPRKRIADIGDVRLALEGVFETAAQAQSGSAAVSVPSRRWGLIAATALLSIALGGLLAWSFAPAPDDGEPTTRLIVRTPDDMPLATQDLPLALSPDGRDLVYAVLGLREEDSQLFHQSLDSFEPRPIEDSRGAKNPFFSPRGDAVGFFSPSAGQLQQVDLAGGSATRLIDSEQLSTGASWGADGSLVFTANWNRPLSILRPGASEAVDLTRLDVGAAEQSHVWPQVLPGDRYVLFTIWSGSPSWDEAKLAVADMQTGEHRVVLSGGTSGRYTRSGHLVFWRGNSLMAVPFDLETLTVAGEPVRVVPNVRLFVGPGAAQFAVSDAGTLAYVEGGEGFFSESFLVDRSGRRLTRLDDEIGTGDPAFSPDGTRLALTLYRGGAFGVGVFDVERGQLTSVAMDGDSLAPSWTSDGDRVTFVSNRDGEYSWYAVRSDGSGAPEPLFTDAQGFSLVPSTWSADGRYLVYDKVGAGGRDVWVQEADEGTEPRPLIATAAGESAPALSPDGRFIAYESDESGKVEIYVRPFPQVEARRELVSRSGGHAAAWSRDGTEIFYLSETGIMRVPVTYGDDDTPRFGQPSLFLEMSGIKQFDVSPDGNTFAIERLPVETLAREIHVVLNWYDELNRLVPTP